MRSQVQVLAGPPPIVAAHSAAGTELGALAAGLGRAGAARHPRRHVQWPLQVRPPGRQPRRRPPTVVAHPTRGRQPGGGAATSRYSPHPRPPRSCPRRAHRTPAWPAWSLSGQARPPRPAPNPAAGSATDLPPTNPSSAASPASRPPGPSIEPSTARQPPGPPPVPVVTVARPPRPGPQRHRLSGRRRTRPDGRGRHQTAGHRTGGQQTAGRWMGGQQTAERRTLWTTTPGDRTPDGWTAGSRTPKPDGWTPHAGHRRPTPWLACWQGRPRRRRPTSRYRADAVRRATTRTAQQQETPRAPTLLRTDWPPPRPSAAGGTPPSSWRLGALLSCVGFGWYEERAMGLRKGEVCGVRLVRECGGRAGEGVLMGC